MAARGQALTYRRIGDAEALAKRVLSRKSATDEMLAIAREIVARAKVLRQHIKDGNIMGAVLEGIAIGALVLRLKALLKPKTGKTVKG